MKSTRLVFSLCAILFLRNTAIAQEPEALEERGEANTNQAFNINYGFSGQWREFQFVDFIIPREDYPGVAEIDTSISKNQFYICHDLR